MDTQQLLDLVLAQKWLPLASLVIGFLVRMVKSDTRLPIDIPAKWRPVLALALGGVAAFVDSLEGGTTVHAAAFGLLAPLGAILGHHVVIEKLRGGREIAIPGAMKKSAPPTIGAAIIFCALSVGCAGTFDEARVAGAHERKVGAAPGSPERCTDLSDAEDLWASVGMGAAAVSGTSAGSTFFDEVRDREAVMWVAGGVAVGAAALSGFSGHMASRKGAAYVRECSGR